MVTQIVKTYCVSKNSNFGLIKPKNWFKLYDNFSQLVDFASCLGGVALRWVGNEQGYQVQFLWL